MAVSWKGVGEGVCVHAHACVYAFMCECVCCTNILSELQFQTWLLYFTESSAALRKGQRTGERDMGGMPQGPHILIRQGLFPFA